MLELYPYVESLKVCAAYAALLYVWPNIVFRSYLKGKGLTFRFMFCNTAQMVLINGVVLGLGLLHILNVWVVRALFWGTLAVSLGVPAFRRRKELGHMTPVAGRLLVHGMGWKLLLVRALARPVEVCKAFWRKEKRRVPEYLLLTVILLFGMAYFSSGAFQFLSYGWGDEYVHHEWILGLKRGEIYSGGIYPAGMHCFIYGMNILFGVKIYSCIVFLPGFYNSAFLVAAYCFMKEIYQRREISLFVLTAWLTFGGIGEQALEGIYEAGGPMLDTVSGVGGQILGLLTRTRMMWTLPEEFGLCLVLVCPWALLRFLREQKESENKWYQWYRNKHLLILATGVGASLDIHFYVTIVAFFTCLAVLVVYFWKMQTLKRFFSLAAAVFSGAAAGAFPIITAFAMGMKGHGSFAWALGLIQGSMKSSSQSSVPNSGQVKTTSPSVSVNLLKGIYEEGYERLFGEGSSMAVLLFSVFAIVFILMGATYFVCGKKQSGVSLMKRGTAYLVFTVMLAFLVTLLASPYIGLPRLLEIERVDGLFYLLAFMVVGIAADILFSLVSRRLNLSCVKVGAALICAAIYVCAYLTNFHVYPYWEMVCYPSSVLVTEKIMDTYPQFSYTIISMNSELHQVIEQGRHEELLTFVQTLDEGTKYTIPTEYLFLYVEKHPIPYPRSYHFTGPAWLAKENICASYWNFDRQEQLPTISLEAAEEPREYFAEAVENYKNIDMRTNLNSKAYAWYLDFAELYPLETAVYYEDDDFVCYLIHQNPQSLFDLSI